MLIGLVASTLGAFLYGAATVLQARAVIPSRRTTAARRWLFAAGLMADATAWLLSLVAFRHLPLAAAQAVLASSVAVTAVLANLGNRTRTGSRTLVASALFVLGAALIASSAAPVTPHALSPLLLVCAAGALAAVSLAAATAYRRGSATWLSVLAGVAFAGTAVCGRFLESHLTAMAILDALLLVAFSLVGIVAFGRALTRGSEAATSAVMWTTELILAFVTGSALLGDTIRPGLAVVDVAGALCSVLACRLLVPVGGNPPVRPDGSSRDRPAVRS